MECGHVGVGDFYMVSSIFLGIVAHWPVMCKFYEECLSVYSLRGNLSKVMNYSIAPSSPSMGSTA